MTESRDRERIAARVKESLGEGLLRRVSFDFGLSSATWFRVGGAATALFEPETEEELREVLRRLPSEIPILVLGGGSNLLARDGGFAGAAIRLGRGFSFAVDEDGGRMRFGGSLPDAKASRFALERSLDGLTFLRGIPGLMGGAVRMNAGAYGGDISDVFVEARAIDRRGRPMTLSPSAMEFSYRHCGVDSEATLVSATLRGARGDRDVIAARMREIVAEREATQPVASRTGGSTFKNPKGDSAWRLLDAAGMRGRRLGGARFSERHCNFLINEGDASAADLESLGERGRDEVRRRFGIDLEWEIERVGEAFS